MQRMMTIELTPTEVRVALLGAECVMKAQQVSGDSTPAARGAVKKLTAAYQDSLTPALVSSSRISPATSPEIVATEGE